MLSYVCANEFCGWSWKMVAAESIPRWIVLAGMLAAAIALRNSQRLLTIGISWGVNRSSVQLNVVAKDVAPSPLVTVEEPSPFGDCHLLGLEDAAVADEEDFNVAGARQDEKAEEDDGDEGWSFAVPSWASSLLQPLIDDEEEQEEVEEDQEHVNNVRSRIGAAYSSRWDAVFRMHSEVDLWKRKARDEVVRIFGHSKSRLVNAVVHNNMLLVAAEDEEEPPVVKLWEPRAKRLVASSTSRPLFNRQGVNCFDLRMLGP